MTNNLHLQMWRDEAPNLSNYFNYIFNWKRADKYEYEYSKIIIVENVLTMFDIVDGRGLGAVLSQKDKNDNKKEGIGFMNNKTISRVYTIYNLIYWKPINLIIRYF